MDFEIIHRIFRACLIGVVGFLILLLIYASEASAATPCERFADRAHKLQMDWQNREYSPGEFEATSRMEQDMKNQIVHQPQWHNTGYRARAAIRFRADWLTSCTRGDYQ